MNSMIDILFFIVTPIVVLCAGALLGCLIERRRVSTKLRVLSLGQEEFEYLLDELGLDDNPLDRRSRGEE